MGDIYRSPWDSLTSKTTNDEWATRIQRDEFEHDVNEMMNHWEDEENKSMTETGAMTTCSCEGMKVLYVKGDNERFERALKVVFRIPS